MEPLHPGKFYHIYNRGNNRDTIFYQKKNYFYFLKKYDKYLSDWLSTYAFCLLRNHFHLLVKVKDKSEISLRLLRELDKYIAKGYLKLPKDVEPSDLAVHDKFSRMIIEQFRRLFISYSQAINKQEGRVGSLFQKTFKRKHIDSDDYLINVICYIHTNPYLHNSTSNFRTYPFSSYPSFLNNKFTKLKKDSVIKWFGSQKEFIQDHNTYLRNKREFDWIIED